MTKPMMKCGHAANAEKALSEEPCCAICLGIHPGAGEVDENPGSLEDRKAKCMYCKKEADSKPELPFFGHTPTRDQDEYYCGCRGWG